MKIVNDVFFIYNIYPFKVIDYLYTDWEYTSNFDTGTQFNMFLRNYFFILQIIYPAAMPDFTISRNNNRSLGF